MLFRLLVVFKNSFLLFFFKMPYLSENSRQMHKIRTNTARNPNQPIAMSEKSSNFALAFGTWVAMADTLRRRGLR